MSTLYTLTILLGAALLFAIQPMVARMLLPSLGGTPGVWNTCMVFFQASLLAGYAYAHCSVRFLGVRRQVALHLGVLVLPLACLPFALPDATDSALLTGSPAAWLLSVLLVMVALPFFAVATSSPLLQRWFACTDHPQAADPYFLYSASNWGSVLALLAYPAVIEPTLTLQRQAELWRYGYIAWLVASATCAVLAARAGVAATARPQPAPGAEAEPARSGPRRLRWVALAAVPSSAMLGVTTHVTTDVASAPLWWVIPLAIYLASFALVFARRPPLPHRWLVRVFPPAVLSLLLLMLMHERDPPWLILSVHVGVFFVIAMVCHGELAADRPPVAQLTGFYLLLSVGGVLGGAFNALASPLLFDSIAEYPLALFAACLLYPGARRAPREVSPTAGRAAMLRELAWPLLPPVLMLVVARAIDPLTASLHLPEVAWVDVLKAGLIFGLPMLVCYGHLRRGRGLRFALGLGALLVVGFTFHQGVRGRVLVAKRSFYGLHRVIEIDEGWRILLHGTTEHGMQSTDPARQQIPVAYFHRTGPLGHLLAALPGLERIGLVGLGVGTTAAYLGDGQRLAVHELDPTVVEIAENARYFTYLRDARRRGLDIRVILGDARVTLAEVPSQHYELLILDAFSSDALPIHLITREALALYRKVTAADGAILFQISNRYFDLRPAMADLAADAGMRCAGWDDLDVPPALAREGKFSSQWILLGLPGGGETFDRITRTGGWRTLAPRIPPSVWTDDFSNVLSALR